MSNEDLQLIPYRIQHIDKTPQEHIPLGVRMINAQDYWESGNQGEGVTIAVIDTGVDYKHPDLKNRIVGGADFTGGGDFYDNNGHGTHAIGTVAASNQGAGIVGVAPKANILALKSLSDKGFGSLMWTVEAVLYAIEQEVEIISMSLGGAHLPALQNAIKLAHSKGITVVAAAGNEGDGNKLTPELSFPGYYDEVVNVGAVDFAGNLAGFSNTNSRVDVLAPGVGILSTYKDGQYAVLDGTSMACPHVAGAIALMKNAFKDDKGILDLAR